MTQIDPAAPGLDGLPPGTELAALELSDNFNTEIAESTFSSMSSIRKTLRSLTAARAECLAGLWVDAHNERILRRRGGEYSFEATPGTPRRLWDPLAYFGRDAPPPLVT